MITHHLPISTPTFYRYDLKMEEEARNYDPFGRGGGGAPMRDASGEVICEYHSFLSRARYRPNWVRLAPNETNP